MFKDLNRLSKELHKSTNQIYLDALIKHIKENETLINKKRANGYCSSLRIR